MRHAATSHKVDNGGIGNGFFTKLLARDFGTFSGNAAAFGRTFFGDERIGVTGGCWRCAPGLTTVHIGSNRGGAPRDVDQRK